MLRQRSILLLATILLVAGGVWFTRAHAATTTFSIESIGGQIGLGNTDLKQVIINVIKWALGLLSLVAVVYMMYGGYLWLTAGGNESRVEKAKQVILQAAIGIVIILLAWAIVFFVVKTTANLTNGEGNGHTTNCQDISDPTCTGGGGESTFDITAVNTCAQPKSWENVPRSSAVAFTFNTDLQTTTHNDATTPPTNFVQQAVGTGANDLQIVKCSNANCTGTPITPNPAPIDGQVYTPGSQPAGTAASPKAEWVANANTLTFYHLTLKQCQGGTKGGTACTQNSDCTDVTGVHTCQVSDRYFEPNTTYRISIPKGSTNSKALEDVRDRVLSYCRTSTDINSTIDHCDDSSSPDRIFYTFTTSQETTGPAFKTESTVPSSEYLTNTLLSADRSVPRSEILGVNFSGGVDPSTVTTGNFRVYKITGAPQDTRTGFCPTQADPRHPCDETAIDPAKFIVRVNSGGTGAWLQFAQQGDWYEPFTWYRVEVSNMRNLCGTVANAISWVFQTNDVTPGVAYVYPENEFQYSCPSTEVFAQFRTSMWNIASATCEIRDASSFNTRPRAEDSHGNNVGVRSFAFTDQRQDPHADPNQYCKHLAFDPTTAELTPGEQYKIGIISDLVVNQNNTKLEYGDAVAGFTPATNTPPWHFTVKPADQCFQAPYITKVSPGHDANGACISVIGNYFDPKNDGQGANDTLGFGTLSNMQMQTKGTDIKSWSNSVIVDKLNAGSLPIGPTGTTYNYQVGVEYPAPVGMLRSALSTESQFRLDGGAASQRPCLYSLSSNQGYAGETQFSATGEHFGQLQLQAQVQTDNHSPWSVTDPTAWTDSNIGTILVNAAATPNPVNQQPLLQSRVSIRNSTGQVSNELPFAVIQHSSINPNGPSAPYVLENSTCNAKNGIFPSPNPYKGDQVACINGSITVKFSTQLDATTVPSAATLYSCSDAACAPATLTPVAANATGNGDMITITPAANLQPDTNYKVILGIGIRSSAHIAMQQPYSWQFKTKVGNDPCIISDMGLNPNGPQVTHNPNYQSVGLTALPMDNACHTINAVGLHYNWSNSNTAVGNLLPLPLTNTLLSQETLTAPLPNGAATGTTNVTVSAQSLTSTAFSLTYNATACATTSDCQQNILGELCSGSVCKAGNCTPVVNSMDPDNGPEKTWTTIRGCWFGSYDAAKSKVIFSSSKEGVVPDPTQCGNGTWTNERIIREVPTGAIEGQIEVQRNDGEIATSTFAVNDNPLAPGACRITPTSGIANDPATLDGRGFATKGANDAVNFSLVDTTTNHAATTSTWADASIALRTPVDAVNGWNEVRVQKGAALRSNSVLYNKTATNGNPTDISCAATSQCIFGQDASCNTDGLNRFGCSYPAANGLGCCVLRPKITGTTPPMNQTNICSNALPQITFDQPLDNTTVNTQNVQYINDDKINQGQVQLENNTSNGTITYIPSGSIFGPQVMSLQPLVTSAPVIFTNQSFETVDAASATPTKPTGWIYYGSGNPTQSTEVPDQHTGFSLQMTANALSIAAQTVLGTNDGGTYRITGWARIQGTAGTGGIRTMCDSGSCGFDQSSVLQGAVHADNVWHYVDFLVHDDTYDPAAPTHHNLSVQCMFVGPGKMWCDDIQITRVATTATKIRGTSGVLIDPTGSPLTYEAGNRICAMDGVRVSKTDMYFSAANQQDTFDASAFKDMGSYRLSISQSPDNYEWEWSGLSSKDTVATRVFTPATVPAHPSGRRTLVTATGNGVSDITATAKITVDTTPANSTNRTYTGSSRAHVDFCVNPWLFTDSNQNCDVGRASCRGFNFTLSYCGDRASTPLPNFVYQGSAASESPNTLGSVEGVNVNDPTRLKSYFFKESASSHDTIGLLIFKNDEFLSPSAWFAKRFPLDTSGASTTVAGYPAVKTGTTTYIGVTNLNESGQLEGLMFVFDYNSNNASQDTVDIADQILSKSSFNTNVTNKDALIRDTQRRQDLASLKINLLDYKAKHGSYPALASGTYIPGFTTSLWPSWQSALGTELSKTLPPDPTNTFSGACPAGAEASTCWAESTKTFTCPTNPYSHLYGYRVTSSGVDLYATMEYAGGFTSAVPSGICTAPSTCDCFGYTEHLAP